MTSTPRPDRLFRLGLGFVAGCIAAVFFYALLRLVQWRLFPEADPASVVWSPHAGYYWRCSTVSYAGAMVGFLAYGGAVARSTLTLRALHVGLLVAVASMALQAVFVP